MGRKVSVALCAMQAVNNVAFSAEKRVLLVERYFKTESSETTQSDYSHRFGSVVWKSVKQFRQAGNVNTRKIVRRLTVVTETRKAEVSDGLGPHQVTAETNWNTIRQLMHCNCFQSMLVSNCYPRLRKVTSLLWVVACRRGEWPSHVRRDFFLRWGVVPCYMLCEVSENSHAAQEVLLHCIRIAVWFAVSHRRTVGPIFLKNIW
jgi:hypothetical protein